MVCRRTGSGQFAGDDATDSVRALPDAMAAVRGQAARLDRNAMERPDLFSSAARIHLHGVDAPGRDESLEGPERNRQRANFASAPPGRPARGPGTASTFAK